MGILYAIEKLVFTFIGDIKVHGWKRPLWFTINARGYQIKGEHYRIFSKLIQPGDIILRRYNDYLDSYLIPGFWNHTGIYTGEINENPEQVVHSISEGVLQEDLLNFIRTDHLVILRPTEEQKAEAIEKALKIVGKEYDFGFDFKDSVRFSCTELVSFCYPKLKVGKKRFFKFVIIADDFYNCSDLKIVWDSTKDQTVTSMGVVESFFAKE